MGWTLLEVKAETGIRVEKRNIHTILREDHLRKIALKRVQEALTEVEKWTRYAICNLLLFFFKILNIHTSKST
jgi:hypothetical protein